MNILVEEVGSVNKGAFLMFKAIQTKLSETYKNNLKIVTDENRFSAIEIAENNLYRVANFQKYKIPFHNIVDVNQLYRFNLINEDNIDSIINAGGYSTGDFWLSVHGEKKFNKRLERYKRLKKKGKKIILLPQAFDTFNSTYMRRFIKELYEVSDLIIARDKVSYNNMTVNLKDTSKIKLFPDFTNLIEVNNENPSSKKVTIIPNSKLIQTKIVTEEGYLNFLYSLVSAIDEMDYDVNLLNHEGESDLLFINKLSEKLEFEHKITTNISPLEVKQEIGTSKLVITGRFHGLVSALSQSIPCFATSWSHKYKELLNDYDSSDLMIDITNSKESLTKVKVMLTDSSFYAKKKNALETKSSIQKQKSREMWSKVVNILNNNE